MNNKTYFLNTMLAIVLGCVLLAAVLVRTFAPVIIIPELNIPNMVLLSVVALELDHYLAKGAKRCYICIPVFAAIAFGLLPYVAGFAAAALAVKLALIGAVVFTMITFLFTSIQDRLSSGPVGKLAPILSGACLYLASQCMVGILL